VKDFADALRFLTRLPSRESAGTAGFGARAFPVVGLLLGIASIVVDTLLGSLDVALRNVAIVAAGALATGALHYDALADVLDAAGAADREERLRIMRDGTVGTYAVLGLVLVVATELAALGAVAEDVRWRALACAPVVGRFAMVVCAYGAPSARSEGLGADFVRTLAGADVGVASLTAIVLAAVFGRTPAVFACLIAAVASYTLRRMATTRLGGVTGDVIGASGKLAEVILLVVFAAR
jgi:adenosylcobinamide-GDP ribazoletransferase